MTYLPVIGFPGMFIPALQYFVILTLSRVYVQVHPFFGRSDIFVKELVSLSFVKLKYSTGYQRLKELLVNPIKDDDIWNLLAMLLPSPVKDGVAWFLVENLYRMNRDIGGKVDNKNAVLQSTFCVVIAVNALGGRAVLPSGGEE